MLLTVPQVAEELPISHYQVSNIRVGKAWARLAGEMGYEPKPLFKRKPAA